MHLPENSNFNITDYQAWLCPNLKIHWQILPVFDSNQVFLQAIKTEHKLLFSAIEGYALKHFDGTLTVKQVQEDVDSPGHVLPFDPPGTDKPPKFNFKKSDQPLVGVIDTGFSAKNPDIDYSRVKLGRDRTSSQQLLCNQA